MSKPSISDILELTIPERIRLVQAIWDSIAEFPEAVPLTDAQKQLLDDRLQDLEKDPDAGSPWPEIKARILSAK